MSLNFSTRSYRTISVSEDRPAFGKRFGAQTVKSLDSALRTSSAWAALNAYSISKPPLAVKAALRLQPY